MFEFSQSNIIQPLPVSSETASKDIELSIKREDLIHPVISGNKFRKLYYNIQEAKRSNNDTLLTFGGAYSNHILATAGAGAHYGLKTVGVIRGDELGVNLSKTLANNMTLQRANNFGMQFKFVSRADYQNKDSEQIHNKLLNEFPNAYLIPEGGTNDLAIKGCREILSTETDNFDYICVSMGTGGTLSGIVQQAKPYQMVLGFPALKAKGFEKYVIQGEKFKDNWKLIDAYHFGGYAKITKELVTFINEFKANTNIPLDPVYTGKTMFGVYDLLANDFFPAKSKILVIHTGGLQGISGMNSILQKRGWPLINV
ncbi:MAG: 1-aminocyclopropane-1-carboxylate deaminase/D-cysteine desulfhydrase [Flavicella sp.]